MPILLFECWELLEEKALADFLAAIIWLIKHIWNLCFWKSRSSNSAKRNKRRRPPIPAAGQIGGFLVFRGKKPTFGKNRISNTNWGFERLNAAQLVVEFWNRSRNSKRISGGGEIPATIVQL